MEIINPATEQIIATIKVDNQKSLNQKFKLLVEAQKKWANLEISERILILEKFVVLIKENIDELSLILTSEMGKPLQQSRNEIIGAGNKVLWLTQNAEEYLSDEIMSISDQLTEKIVYEPLGVVCNISAWNYPYNVGVNIFVPALLAGNSVMYKPSEYATLTGIEIDKYLKLAGVPKDVFQLAIGKGDIGETLLDMPFNGFYFTGSYKTGKYIYERIAHKLVPCQLELGGKDPVYVTNEVSNVKSVALGISDGVFYNNGQSCCSVERIYVHKEIYEEFVEEFIKEVQSWKIGNPLEDGVYISVLTRKEQLEVLEKQVEDALSSGAICRIGGKKIGSVGYFFQPTVLLNVKNNMKVMQEESFGPIIGIMKVENDEEAIYMMNDTVFGLTAAVYSSSQSRAEGILAKIDSGSGYWNCCDRVSAALPWTGRKHSGFGSTLSHQGIRAFSKVKSYHLRK